MRKAIFLLLAVALVAAICMFAIGRKPDVSRDAGGKAGETASPKELVGEPPDARLSAPNRPVGTPSDARGRALYRKAQEQARANRLEDSLKTLDRIVDEEDRSWYAPFALYQKGNWLSTAGRTKEARKAFAAVQKRYPKHYLSARAGEKIAKLDLREKRLAAILDTKDPKPFRIEGIGDGGLPGSADCGPECLLEACNVLGIEAAAAELKSLAKTTEQGTTMLNLAEAARAKGLNATGKIVNYQYLQEMDKPVIAWVDGNHYVLIKDVGGSGLRVYDPKEGERLVPRREFCRGGRGQVLALSLPGRTKR